ncbi:MAG TPA: TonB-dependent receptor [Longimicrobiales bacterium]|nr:TonB-dependent receptor [Longimicrobiales bacterium]
MALFALLTPSFVAAQAPPIPLDTLWFVYDRASQRFPATTRGVEIIGYDQLVDSPARNLADVLTWALGIEILARSSAHAQASVRGGTNEQVVILVDGVRVSHGPSGPHAPDVDIPIDQIERIEVMRGTGSTALAGEAAAGVINVITRRDTDAGVSVHAEGGSFGGLDAGVSARIGGPRAHLAVTASHHQSEGHRPGTDARVSRAGLLATLGTGRHTVRGRITAATSEFGAAGFFAPYPEYDPYDSAKTFDAALAWELAPTSQLTIEPHALLQLDRDDYVLRRGHPEFYRNRHDGWRAGGGINVHFRRDAALRVLGGAQYYRETMRTSNASVAGAPCSLSLRCQLSRSSGAAFAEVNIGESGQAALTTGARAEWHSDYGFYIVPSVSIAFWPGDAMRIRAGTGVSRRVPTWTERFYQDSANIGDPDLVPERSQGIELGADLLATPNLRVNFTGFMRRMDNLIDWIRPLPPPPPEGEESEPGDDDEAPFDQRWRAVNVEQGDFDGVEAEITAHDFLGARVSFKAMGVTYRAPSLDSIASRFAFRPMTRVVSLAVDRAFGDHVVLSARILNGRRRAEPMYYRVDARLSIHARRTHIYLDATNLTGSEYLDVTGIPAAPRGFFLGASWGWSPN